MIQRFSLRNNIFYEKLKLAIISGGLRLATESVLSIRDIAQNLIPISLFIELASLPLIILWITIRLGPCN